MNIFQPSKFLKASRTKMPEQPTNKKRKLMVGAIKKARNDGVGQPMAKSLLTIGADTSNYRQLTVLTASQMVELEKSVRGFIKPGHKYLRREMKGDRWVYYYLEDVGTERAEEPGEDTPRRLLGKEDILITELDRKGRTNIEERVKLYVDKTSAEYSRLKRIIRKKGGWLNNAGIGTLSIESLRQMFIEDKAFARKVIFNEWGSTLVRKIVDQNLAELLDPEIERPDLEEAKAHNPRSNYECTPPKTLRTEFIYDGKAQKWDGIHPYQKAGINYLFEQKAGILGFDVGLGKTLTALSAAEKYFEQKAEKGEKWKPCLITCPNEVQLNWYREMGQYFEGVNEEDVLILPPGGAAGRALVKELADSGKLKQYRYVIGGYGWMMDDESAEYLAHLQDWGIHIVDEAHRLKSSRAHVSDNYDTFFRDGRKMQEVRDKEGTITERLPGQPTGSRSEYQWFLTATPIPNAIEEGYTMLEHLSGGEDASTKERKYRRLKEKARKRVKGSMSQQMIEAMQQAMLLEIRDVFREKAMIKTYADDDVRATLPPMEEKLWEIPMNSDQQALYDLALSKALHLLEQMMGESQTIKRMKNPMALLTRLNQITIHPKLVFPDYKGRSAKMDWLTETVGAHYKNEKDGIVVMCEQIQALNIAKKQLMEEQGIPADQIVIIDQKLKGKEKDDLIMKFNRGEIRVLLGGKTAEEGINLQRGSHKLIHMDIPWVPKSLVQRNGRVARQGQKNPVQVFFPITRGASDVHRLSLLYEKLTLNESVLNIDNLDTLADGKMPGTDEELGITDVMHLLRVEAAHMNGTGEDIPKTYQVMGDEWKKKSKAPDGDTKEMYHFPNGDKVPVDALTDMTKDFRDVKIPKQWKEVFNYSLHSLLKMTNADSWMNAIRAKRPRLTIRKTYPTIRELINDDGYAAYYNTAANQIVVDTKNATSLAHEMAHYMRFTHRDERALKTFTDELKATIPEYFERMTKTNATWTTQYLAKPEELWARMFEQTLAYKTKEANPNFHPMIAKSFESYTNIWYYPTGAEFEKVREVLEKNLVDRDGNRLFPMSDLDVPGQPKPGAEEVKAETKKEPKAAKLSHEAKVEIAIAHLRSSQSIGNVKHNLVMGGLTDIEAAAVAELIESHPEVRWTSGITDKALKLTVGAILKDPEASVAWPKKRKLTLGG